MKNERFSFVCEGDEGRRLKILRNFPGGAGSGAHFAGEMPSAPPYRPPARSNMEGFGPPNLPEFKASYTRVRPPLCHPKHSSALALNYEGSARRSVRKKSSTDAEIISPAINFNPGQGWEPSAAGSRSAHSAHSATSLRHTPVSRSMGSLPFLIRLSFLHTFQSFPATCAPGIGFHKSVRTLMEETIP